MRETVGFGVLAVFLLQASPASGFGGGPLMRPSKTGGSPATSTRYSSCPRTSKRQEEHGRGGLLVPGATVDGAGGKEEPAKAKSAPKKAVGGLAGWDWGFKSTVKKPAAAPAKAEPVAVMKAETGGDGGGGGDDGVDAKAEKAALDAEAAEIAEVKRKAAAEIKAEQAVAAAEAAGIAEVEEVKRQAAAEILAEQEEAKARKKEIAERAAKSKRAEEMAAIARGDAPKKAAAKKPPKEDEKGEEKKAEPAKADPAKVESTKAKPVKAEAAKAKPAKAEPARKSSAGTGGWDWGFKSTPRKTAAKPAAAGAVKAKPADEKAEAKKEAKKAKAKALEEGRAAAAAAAAAEAEKIAEIERKAAAEIEEKAAAAAKAKAEAKAEAGAARARHEQRAQEMAAEARGDVPKPKKKAARKKKSAGTDDRKKEDGDKKKEDAEKKTKKSKKATSKKEETPKDDKKDDAAGGGDEAAADGTEKEGGTAAEKGTPAKTEKKASTGGGGGGWGRFGFAPPSKEASTSSITLTKPETIVVVTGATGRVGSLAVRRLLELYPNVLVRAVVTDMAKGKRLLKEEIDKYGIKLEIVSAELGGMRSAAKVVAGASAVVFCASGFAQNLSPIERLANAVRLTINPSSVADVEGVRDVATALKATKKLVSKASKAQQEAKGKAEEGGKAKEDEEPEPLYPNAPRFVLLSSAAVTRPNWSSEDKALYPLSADVPIVKLNPLNILTVKAQGEKELREVGIPYVVVRPCGLNDDHPRGRPIFSVGDTAAGRICREDVADVLVRCLGTPEATGKTFEVQSLPGFEKVASSVKTNNKGNIDQALAGLPTDESLSKDPEMLKNFRRYTYPVLTQLRPVPLVQMSNNDEKEK
ncbi:unnamed protein product [Ectocarpus sp. CCAP 1310/34]|nr:unnamed protein product [Ectocarpus sp. CCAP 1310/34]